MKLPMMSLDTRSSRGRAVSRPSAGTPKVMYLERTIPLLLRAICRFSISTYSPRILSKSSWAIGILTLYRLPPLERWLMKESWNGRALSK